METAAPEDEGGLNVADLPAHALEVLSRAHAELRAELAAGGWPAEDLDRLDRLIHRPCMAKVLRALAALLPGPESWRDFLMAAMLASLPAETWGNTIRPARHRFEQQRAAALRAGRDLLAALGKLTDGMHGFLPPSELTSPAALLERAAIGKGYPPEDARQMVQPLAEDARQRLAARIQTLDTVIAEAKAAGCDMVDETRLADFPKAPAVADLLVALLETLDGWKPGPDGDLFPGQTQGGKAPQVYVRALAHFLEQLAARLCIVPPHGRLLSYDNLARVTRTALDLPDEPPGYPHRQPFDGEDVRRALEVSED
jgi:hypothetical protein